MTGAEQARLSRSRFEQPQGGVGRHAAAGVPPTTRAPQGAAGYQEVGTARSARQQRSQRDSRRAGVAQHATSRAEGVAAYSARRKKGGAGKVVRIVLIAVGIILATAGGAFAWYVNNINSRLGEGITAELRQQLGRDRIRRTRSTCCFLAWTKTRRAPRTGAPPRPTSAPTPSSLRASTRPRRR